MTKKETNDKKQPSAAKKAIESFKDGQSKDAAKTLMEELFNDMYVHRRQVYVVNFVRGIFFGFGSVLGGTLLIALLIWLLTQVGSLVPFASDFIQQVLDTLNSRGN